MTQTYANLIGLLKTKLEGLLDDDDNAIFKHAYAYGENEFEGYPCAVILDKGGAGQVIDTQRIERAFTFDIFLYQERQRQGKQNLKPQQIFAQSWIVSFSLLIKIRSWAGLS